MSSALPFQAEADQQHGVTAVRGTELASQAADGTGDNHGMSSQLSKVHSSSRTVAVSAAWNIVGRVMPIAVAVVCTPILVSQLGPLRWGVFTLALSLTGLFSIFDFGLSRALTRSVAEAIANDREAELVATVRMGVLSLTILGVLGALLMAVGARFWAADLFRIPPDLQREVLLALYVLSASAPIVMLCTALWGVLAAFQRFKPMNLINIPITSLYYLGPAIVIYVYNSLVAVMLVLVACRMLQVLCYWLLLRRDLPRLPQQRLNLSSLVPILKMGGWMSVSNILWPFLTYLDRFIVSSVLSVASAGYYATSVDLVMRLSIVNVAVMNTAFPAMTASHVKNPAETVALFRRCTLAIACILFVPCFLIAASSDLILRVWINADFAAHAAAALSVLAIGGYIVAQDTVVSGLLDGIGRPDLNAKLSVGELLIYVPVLILLLHQFGLIGAALGWTARCLIDFFVRLSLVSSVYAPLRKDLFKVLVPWPIAIVSLAAALYPMSIGAKLTLGVGCLALFLFTVWRYALETDERGWISGWATLKAYRAFPLT